MAELQLRHRNVIVLIGFIQGLLLLLAHDWIEYEIWPATSWLVRVPWYTVLFAIPLALYLLIGIVHAKLLARFTVHLAAVLILLGVYGGWSIGNTPEPGVVLGAFSVTIYIGWHVLLPLAQTGLSIGSWRMPYTSLFQHAWNNALMFAVASIFTQIFFALLMLWAGLFKVLNIALFWELFTDHYFLYLVLPTVFAFAVYQARTHVNAVMAFRRIVLTICCGLFPMLALISLLFLIVLPFSGLQPLWATGHATTLMLTLQIVVILFINAVYQDGAGEPPYHPAIRHGIEASIVTLPIYTALCLYALHLRIGQHGWTVDRVWAVIITVVIGCYSITYAAAALKRRGPWMSLMSPINVCMAYVVIALAVLVNTPLLDARRITANSQVNRLLAGIVKADKFDYSYFRFQLARAGNDALLKLTVLTKHPEAQLIRERANQELAKHNSWDETPPKQAVIATTEQLKTRFTLLPRNTQFDPPFLAYLFSHRHDDRAIRECIEREPCIVLAADLNGDKSVEYILFNCLNYAYYTSPVFSKRKEKWEQIGDLRMPESDCPAEIRALTEVKAAGEVDFQVVKPEWGNLSVGKNRLFFVGKEGKK